MGAMVGDNDESPGLGIDMKIIAHYYQFHLTRISVGKL